ncbi:MAG: DUF6712 family protein, partial [Bacteroidales bacterium]|nr:DUF6712 family protein [Bacteroidales bacterium]
MIKIPFNPGTFSHETKDLVSGVNLTYQYDNIKSRLVQTGVALSKALGKETYEKLVEINTLDSEEELLALDYLKRAMLNFSFYHHLIFIAVRISNDGVTTKKTDEETTAFKYQTDEVKISLVESAWFWMDQLYDLLNTHPNRFSEWQVSTHKKQLDSLYVTTDDFRYIFGVESTHFFVSSMPLIRKTIEEDIAARVDLDEVKILEADTSAVKVLKNEISALIKKAIVYRSLSLACKLYSYYELPAPLRRSADDELHKGTSSEEYVKKSVSAMLANNADQ